MAADEKKTNPVQYDLSELRNQTDSDHHYREKMAAHFQQSSGSVLDKLNNFPRFSSRQSLSLFLAKNEIFKRIVGVHGSIVEAGVFMGGGLFTWAQLSAIYEPINYNRKIIGFDTFAGFPELADYDKRSDSEHAKKGGYTFEGDNELLEAASIHDLTRPLGHIDKIELLKGVAEETIPAYIDENPHLIVSMLYLDFDLYEPTAVALKHFLPRMSKGAVIAFDELNQKNWPGETQAVLEHLSVNEIKIERIPYTPSVSFAVL